MLQNSSLRGARDRSCLYTTPQRTDGGELLIFVEPRLPYLFSGVITFPQERLLGAQVAGGREGSPGSLPEEGGSKERGARGKG